jgi:hypothetical protein
VLSSLYRRAPAGPAAETRRPCRGKKRVEVARDAAGGPRNRNGDARQAARSPDRTDSCTSRSSARCAVAAAAPATERSSPETVPPQPSVLDPERPLAPSEGSNDGSRHRGRAARGAERPSPHLPTADVPVGRAGDPRARARPGGAARGAARGAEGTNRSRATRASDERSNDHGPEPQEQDRGHRGADSPTSDHSGDGGRGGHAAGRRRSHELAGATASEPRRTRARGPWSGRRWIRRTLGHRGSR